MKLERVTGAEATSFQGVPLTVTHYPLRLLILTATIHSSLVLFWKGMDSHDSNKLGQNGFIVPLIKTKMCAF